MESLCISRFLSKSNAFSSLIAASRIVCSCSSYVGSKYVGKRNFTLGRVVCLEGLKSGGNYTEGPKLANVLKRIYKDPKQFLRAYQLWKDELKLWGREWKTRLSAPGPKALHAGEIDMLFTFEEDDAIEKFIVLTDSSNNQGYTYANFVRTQNETALFSGFTDTRTPDDGTTKYAGFASIISKRLLKSFKRFDTYDWTDYTHIVLKLRGDGRTYCVVLGCPSSFSISYQDQFHYPIYTRGGPYWQVAKIPLSNFYFTHKGTIQDQQFTIPLHSCSRVGITVADGITGPFKLEIEYFGLEYKPYHKHISPYEHYASRNIADL